MLSSALITAHLFLQRLKTKELERNERHQQLMGSRIKYSEVLLALLNLSPSIAGAAENAKAEKSHNYHSVGKFKGISPAPNNTTSQTGNI